MTKEKEPLKSISENYNILEIVKNLHDDMEAKKLFNFLDEKIRNKFPITIDFNDLIINKNFIYLSFGSLPSKHKREEIRQYIYLNNISQNTLIEIRNALNVSEKRYKNTNKAIKKLNTINEKRKPKWMQKLNKQKKTK